MKQKFLFFIISFLFIECSIGQLAQASLGPGSTANSIKIYIKTDQSATGLNVSSLQFNIGISTTVTPTLTAAITSTTAAFPAPAFWTINATPYSEGGFNNYSIYTATSPIVISPVAGTPIEVMEVSFSGGPATFPNISLVCLPDGGITNGSALFLFTTSTINSNGSNLFYTGPGVNVSNNFSYDLSGATSGTTTSYATLSNTVLPLNWLSFNATKQSDNAFLNWVVSSDLDNKYFELQRSSNGTNFTAIATVDKQSNSKGKYNYTDSNITSLGSPVLYYRVKQVDFNGKFTYSDTRLLNLNVQKETINIFPNPVKDGFYVRVALSGSNTEKLLLKLINSSGQIINARSITIAEASNYYFDIKSFSLAKGNYFLQISNSDGAVIGGKKLLVN